MEVLRNNTKQDDGSDSIAGVDWFTFNGTTASTIYANGNSWIGFGSTTEHLKVNRRDGALWSLYREEGTLYNYYKFLKIRWKGYSIYNYTTTAYAVEYDVILWDTGDISLRMISIPTSYNTGTYSLVASSTYTYTVSTTSPDITFTKTDSGFTVSNSIIELEEPYERRYLIRSESTYYTVSNNVLSQVSISSLTSTEFLNHGVKKIPNISLLSSLSNPEILYWCEVDTTLESGLVVKGTPALPQTFYYETQSLTDYNHIDQAEVVASDDALFAISFDNGSTWKYYNNGTWNTASSVSEGMSAATLKIIPSNAWSTVTTSTSFKFRCTLPTLESFANGIYIRCV